MSEADMAIIKPEMMMKSYIWLETTDGSIQQVEQEIAMYCPMICHEVLQKGLGAGSSKNCAISLPQRVNPAMLSLILDYCRFHQVPGRSNKERKVHDEKFIRMDTKRLCELASAADSLQLKPLVDLSSRALARIIEGKTPEEIREIFHLPDDLTEEEKLEPLKNLMDDPRIRLLNRLYAKKRKELKEREKLKGKEVEERVDERSVDDLLSFINGKDHKVVKTSKSKKKNKKRKEHKNKVSHNLHSKQQGVQIVDETASSLGGVSNLPSMEDDIFSLKTDSEDGYVDDGMDPVLKEMLDREVEDFARRLNSSWVLSSGQERQPVHFSINGNGATRRLTAFQVMLGSLILLMVFGWQVPEFCGVTVKGNSRVRISGLTGTEGEDEWFDLSYLILNEASDPPKYDNVPADREELVGDVLSFTLLFPFELQLCISELELTLRGHKPLYAHIIELREL
uniref:SKP1 component dimerisation domain-containing protein n=1 Tax=Brassica campestris TaxID=3711 RepID=M4CGW6_BRACM